MALKKLDRVQETTTSTGTGGLTLAGATTRMRAFSATMSNGDTAYCLIENQSANEWEISLCTYNSGTLTRSFDSNSVSSTGGLVPFSAGTKVVSIIPPANTVPSVDGSGNFVGPIAVISAGATAVYAQTSQDDQGNSAARRIRLHGSLFRPAIQSEQLSTGWVASDLLLNANGGNVGIGGAFAPLARLHVYAGASGTTPNSDFATLGIESSGNTGISLMAPDANTSGLHFGSASLQNGAQIYYQYSSGLLTFYNLKSPGGYISMGVGVNDMFHIKDDASVCFPSIGTTASAANAFLNSGSTPANSLLRSTSSEEYKKDIEPLDHARADAVVQDAQPIWYRSLAAADNPDWGWYGFSAEQVATLEPRLVTWGYHDDDWEVDEVYEDKDVVTGVSPILGPNGEPQLVVEKQHVLVRRDRKLKAGAQLKPDGVAYERISVMLLDVVRRQGDRITALETALAALTARVAALEPKPANG
jgi:hypothetical protein